MSPVFRSAIPALWKSLQISRFSPYLVANANRGVWIVASIAIAFFALSTVLFRAFLVRSHQKALINIKQIKDQTPLKNLPSTLIKNDPSVNPKFTVDPKSSDHSSSSFLGNSNLSQNKDVSNSADLNKDAVSDNDPFLHTQSNGFDNRDSKDLGMTIMRLEEDIESEKQLLNLYADDEAAIIEIKLRIANLETQLDTIRPQYIDEANKINLKPNLVTDTLTSGSTPSIPTLTDPSDSIDDQKVITQSSQDDVNTLNPNGASIAGSNTTSSNSSDLTAVELSDLGMTIMGLEDDLLTENQTLQHLLDDKDIISTKSRIQSFENKLATARELYKKGESKLNFKPNSAGSSLQDVLQPQTFNDVTKNLEQTLLGGNVKAAIADLSKYIDAIANDEKSLMEIFGEIDKILFNKVFTDGTGRKLKLSLDEDDKRKLKPLQDLFPILEKHILFIGEKDPDLAIRLKIKMANLPIKVGKEEIEDGRIHYPNLHLNEVEQLKILIDHFQRKEDQKTDAFVDLIQNNKSFTDKNIRKIAKMAADDKSRLTPSNRMKIQEALKKKQYHLFEKGNQYDAILKSLNSNLNTYGVHSKEVEQLWRASKAKKFFEAQIGLKEEEILIPRWYHATRHHCINSIITSGEIMVMHKGCYRGAWLSNQWEKDDYGPYVLCFSHRIRKIDPEAHIETHKNYGIRWRGWQNAVPFITPKKDEQYLSYVGIPKNGDKRDLKAKIIKELKEEKKIKNPIVFSTDQISYIHKQLFYKVLGCPNLSGKFFGSHNF